MAYTIPARISKKGSPIPEITVDDEFADLVEGMIVLLQGGGNYPSVRINGKITRLHRHLWAIKYGSCPEILDHINGNVMDSRLCNLRPAGKGLNGRNSSRRHKDSRQDLPKGVTHDPRYKLPYKAQMTVRYRAHCFGHYATPEEAGAVYQAMKFMLILVESALCL